MVNIFVEKSPSHGFWNLLTHSVLLPCNIWQASERHFCTVWGTQNGLICQAGTSLLWVSAPGRELHLPGNLTTRFFDLGSQPYCSMFLVLFKFHESTNVTTFPSALLSTFPSGSGAAAPGLWRFGPHEGTAFLAGMEAPMAWISACDVPRLSCAQGQWMGFQNYTWGRCNLLARSKGFSL